MTDAPALFAGRKVIDCASYVAAPAAATVLGDFGAEIPPERRRTARS
jgi:formyl-CoA transferase